MEHPNDDMIRIAIVDDDKDEHELFVQSLKKLNLPHIVYRASGCHDLFTTLDEEILPDLIFMDINMPLPNGLECLKRLKKHARYKHIPVVMYSVSSASEDIEKAYQGGAHYYIVKPYAPANLPSTLRKVLEHDWKKIHSVPEHSAFVINLSFANE